MPKLTRSQFERLPKDKQKRIVAQHKQRKSKVVTNAVTDTDVEGVDFAVQPVEPVESAWVKAQAEAAEARDAKAQAEALAELKERETEAAEAKAEARRATPELAQNHTLLAIHSLLNAVVRFLGASIWTAGPERRP